MLLAPDNDAHSLSTRAVVIALNFARGLLPSARFALDTFCGNGGGGHEESEDGGEVDELHGVSVGDDKLVVLGSRR